VLARGITDAAAGIMETAPGLTRPALKPPRRRTAAIAVACWAGLLALGFLLGEVTSQRSTLVSPISTPIFVDAPKVPAPVVTVNVPPPPPPAPPALPEPPPVPTPRALVPHLEAWCIRAEEGSASLPACSWDDGFPAISADGALVAKKIYDGSPSGADALSIGFFDAHTSRLVRQVDILTLKRDYDAQEKLRPGTARRMQQRVAALQRTLDEGGFRSLIGLGTNMLDTSSEDAKPAGEAAKRIHAEFGGASARIVDPERSAVLWQHTFFSDVPAPPSNPDTDMCGGKSLHSLEMWWDPETGTVLTELLFFTGGCMCSSIREVQLHRIPAAVLEHR
jgi:hypothetical protein